MTPELENLRAALEDYDAAKAVYEKRRTYKAVKPYDAAYRHLQDLVGATGHTCPALANGYAEYALRLLLAAREAEIAELRAAKQRQRPPYAQAHTIPTVTSPAAGADKP